MHWPLLKSYIIPGYGLRQPSSSYRKISRSYSISMDTIITFWRLDEVWCVCPRQNHQQQFQKLKKVTRKFGYLVFAPSDELCRFHSNLWKPISLPKTFSLLQSISKYIRSDESVNPGHQIAIAPMEICKAECRKCCVNKHWRRINNWRLSSRVSLPSTNHGPGIQTTN